VLRDLSRTRESKGLELEAHGPTQGERQRNLQRRRRRQTRSDRKVDGNVAGEADTRTAAVRQLGRDGRDVPAPACGNRPVAGGVDLDRLESVGRENDRSRLRRKTPNTDAELERGRKDEPTRVIRVLADEIDTARREERPRRAASDRAAPAATGSSAGVSHEGGASSGFSRPDRSETALVVRRRPA
jgi:hypothetical protein